MIENDTSAIHDIVCIGRHCYRCKIYKCKNAYGVECCIDVPFEPHFKYAQELYFKKDNTILHAMNMLKGNSHYEKIIKTIRSGGVQYE